MVSEEAVHSICLVIRHGEEVTEPSTAEDDLFTSSFWIVYSRARVDLGSTHGRKETTCNWEAGVEAYTITYRLV